MLLTIELHHPQASDLGYLLHKNPSGVFDVAFAFGSARVFYPEVEADRCRAALILDIDPLSLVKKLRKDDGIPLLPYVNDRPYVASSFMSSALSRCFGTAMGGRSKERQELADTPLRFETRICPLPCRGGEGFLRHLFEPLGYTVTAERAVLDPSQPEFGDSPYYDVRLSHTIRIRDLLRHLFVLIPVLDKDKHYWVGPDEIEKLLDKGEGWLDTHPKKEAITRRYLAHQEWLTRKALQLLEDDAVDRDREDATQDEVEQSLEKKISLDEQRRRAVVSVLENAGASSVADLGCGDGKLVRALLKKKRFHRVLGIDVSMRALAAAERRLKLDTMPSRVRDRLELRQSSLTYRDTALRSFDALCLVEVIEHLDPGRLEAVEHILFDELKPPVLIVTTPNRTYNQLFEDHPPGKLRHPDHRFEWTREEFREWADRQAVRSRSTVELCGIGDPHPEYGSPTQMAVFTTEDLEIGS